MANGITTTDSWKFLTEVIGSNSATLPDAFSELLIVVNCPYDNSYDFTFDIVIPAQEFSIGTSISSGRRWFNGMNDGSGKAVVAITYNASTNSVALADAYFNNSDRKSSTHLRIYYR